jgi:hypothetical protein
MPGNPLPTVPNDLPWLEGMVTPCGTPAPEAVEVTEEDCAARGFGIGKVPRGWGFCPG